MPPFFTPLFTPFILSYCKKCLLFLFINSTFSGGVHQTAEEKITRLSICCILNLLVYFPGSLVKWTYFPPVVHLISCSWNCLSIYRFAGVNLCEGNFNFLLFSQKRTAQGKKEGLGLKIIILCIISLQQLFNKSFLLKLLQQFVELKCCYHCPLLSLCIALDYAGVSWCYETDFNRMKKKKKQAMVSIQGLHKGEIKSAV